MGQQKIGQGEKIARKILGYSAIGVGVVVAGAAALGATPFDRGYTMRCVGNAITSGAPGVISEIKKWADSEE
jgi:hypothetical protein